MPRSASFIPKYCRHKASGQAVVIIAGADFYLGPWKSKASLLEYDRRISEWIAAGRPAFRTSAGSVVTIAEIVLQYWRFAKEYYCKDGQPTGSIDGIKVTLRLLREHYGHTLARDFGPLALAALRQRLIEVGSSRTYINDHLGRIRRVFKWAASQELIPVTGYQALTTVTGLRRGRSAARETEPIGPVQDALVEATLPYLSPVIADMVRFQRATGARPAEVCILRPKDIDRSQESVWAYRPSSHKTEHHGRERVIFIGPKGQEILRKYLLRDAESFCFVPAESESARKSDLRLRRKTPVQPSQLSRRKPNPKRLPGKKFTTDSYRRAIHRAAKRAGVEQWSPNRIRHTTATEIRAKFGLEAAATVLGHSKADVTQLYAERDMAKAAKVMSEVG